MQDIWLIAAKFCNCQSWKDTTIEFAKDKLNVIIADNNVGKSVFMKFIALGANPKLVPTKDERRQMIRYGTDMARLILVFSDYSVVVIQVTEARVSFGYKERDEKTMHFCDTLPQKAIDVLGLVVHKQTGTLLNIIDLDKDLLLVNSQKQANADLLEELYYHPGMSDYLDNANKLRSDFQVSLHRIETAYEYAENSLKYIQYTDVTQMQENLDSSKKLLSALDKLSFITDKLSDEKLALVAEQPNYESVLKICETGQKLQNISKAIMKIDNETFDYTEAIKLATFIIKLTKVLNKLKDVKLAKVIDHSKQLSVANLGMKLQSLLSILNSIQQPSKLNLVSALNLINATESLKMIHENLMKLHCNLIEVESLQNAIAESKVQLKTLGKELECPVYGKVIYNGEVCVPYN